MKKVTLKDFLDGVRYNDVRGIVLRGRGNKTNFQLGFIPQDEFIYEFGDNPDVHVRNLNIKEVLYEPYRIILRLKKPSKVELL